MVRVRSLACGVLPLRFGIHKCGWADWTAFVAILWHKIECPPHWQVPLLYAPPELSQPQISDLSKATVSSHRRVAEIRS